MYTTCLADSYKKYNKDSILNEKECFNGSLLNKLVNLTGWIATIFHNSHLARIFFAQIQALYFREYHSSAEKRRSPSVSVKCFDTGGYIVPVTFFVHTVSLSSQLMLTVHWDYRLCVLFCILLSHLNVLEGNKYISLISYSVDSFSWSRSVCGPPVHVT